jgi:membrane fusion protein, multidrug efflux system
MTLQGEGSSRQRETGTVPEAMRRLKSRRWIAWAAVVVLGAVVGWLGAARQLFGQAKPVSQAAARAIPVVAASARRGDLGVYQSGLGTVTPLRTVTVRSRVDGQLMTVAFKEGQTVREGELLAQIDPRPYEVQLHLAEGQLAKDEAALANAKVDLERYRVLVEQDSVARQQLDTQAATVSQLEAGLKSDQAQVESARLNLTYSRVVAPVSGVVGLRLVDPGNIVHANDTGGIVVITQQKPITVVFTIAADHLPPVLGQLRAGRALTVEAWDRDLRAKLATGSVLAIDNQIDTATGTVRIKALFANDDGALYPNQFVNARLLVDTLHGVVLMPTAALERSPQSTYVWVVKADSTVEMRNVQVALTEGDDTAVKGGLEPGDEVVVDGMDKLQPGASVSLGKEGGTRKSGT